MKRKHLKTTSLRALRRVFRVDDGGRKSMAAITLDVHLRKADVMRNGVGVAGPII